MRDVAIVAFADVSYARSEDDEVELISGVIGRAMAASGITKKEIGFTISVEICHRNAFWIASNYKVFFIAK